MTCPMCPTALNGLPLPGICPGCGVGLPGDLEPDGERHRTHDDFSALARKLLRMVNARA